MNAFDGEPVGIRPMVRADLDALARWERHADARFRAYDVGPLGAAEGEALWRALSEPPDCRRPFVATLGERVVGQLVLRDIDRAAGTADFGIMVDPALIGRGLGRRILRAFAGYCSECGLRRLGLDVAVDNERAIRAYRAAGFVVRGERLVSPQRGMPRTRVLRMETELPPRAFTETHRCEPQ